MECLRDSLCLFGTETDAGHGRLGVWLLISVHPVTILGAKHQSLFESFEMRLLP